MSLSRNKTGQFLRHKLLPAAKNAAGIYFFLKYGKIAKKDYIDPERRDRLDEKNKTDCSLDADSGLYGSAAYRMRRKEGAGDPGAGADICSRTDGGACTDREHRSDRNCRRDIES